MAILHGLPCLRDTLHNGVAVLNHLVVPEPQDAVPASRQEGAALLVLLLLLRVLAAVELDHELGFDATQIHAVGSNGFLAAELCATDLP